MNKILTHCFPGRKLDLPELRNVISQLDNNPGAASDSGSTTVTSPPRSESMRSSVGQQADTAPSLSQEGVVLEEIAHLHEDLGCMMRDSSGEYRGSSSPSKWTLLTVTRVCRC